MTLCEFLVKAKVRGYASEGERGETLLEDGGKELSYREGPYEHRDRYYGFNPFVGEEVVWADGKPIWAMNYFGAVTDASVLPIDVYRFLQQAMRRVDVARPFRGPDAFGDGELSYRDESKGDLDQFAGTERIFRAGREIYRLTYHGGKVGLDDA
jgi:hypothetical protein